MRFTRRLAFRVALGLAVLLGTAAVAFAILFPPDRGGETARVVEFLGLEPGQTVAEIGAGTGWLSMAVARHVGPDGHVYSTELSQRRLGQIEEAVADAALTNVTAIEAGEEATNLSPGCCDAAFMRRVYHHVSKPTLINASLFAALKPGARLAIIEFRDDGWLGTLTGMGIAPDRLVAEVTAAGFRHVETSDWPGAAHYVVVFERP